MCRLNHLKPIISYRQLKKQRDWLVEISLLLILELLIQINLGAGTKKNELPRYSKTCNDRVLSTLRETENEKQNEKY